MAASAPTTRGRAPAISQPHASSDPGILRPVFATFAITILLMLVVHVATGADSVGLDNDDTMRLVQVRDLLAGQGWFDLTQVRLGLEGGTPMHWSRLVDLPIANLIVFFSHFMGREAAEAAALAVWPAMTMLALFAGLALAARRLGGEHAMVAGLLLGAVFAATSNRFGPGSIDHHNVQMALLAVAVAGIVDPRMGKRSFAMAGAATGLAIAVGAETVPLMAVLCVSVALLLALAGARAKAAAEGFGLALALTLTVVFYATVPPRDYGAVVCDAFSAGFYTLGTLGGAVLFLSAALTSGRSRAVRLAALATGGAVVGAAVLVIAPHCLASPLADLDPMLKTMWLDHVTEAQSFAAALTASPESLPGHYLLPAAALVLALWRARGEARVQNLVLAALIFAAFAVSLVQVRGAVFANLLAILVFAPLVGDARARLRAAPKSPSPAAAFCLAALLSAQATWLIGGAALANMLRTEDATGPSAADFFGEGERHLACRSEDQMALIAAQPIGVVSAVSNIGDDILRFSGHRVLSAPYHRNQGGMLTQLHIAGGTPAAARAFLQGAGVTLLVFCPGDPETRMVARGNPDSLYAALLDGRVPPYLTPVSGGADDAMRLFAVR